MGGSRGTGSSRLVKRSLALHGHATSVALEESFWKALSDWAAREGMSAAALISSIDRQRQGGSLASAIRVAVLHEALHRAGEGPR